jgi:hypothetical protein
MTDITLDIVASTGLVEYGDNVYAARIDDSYFVKASLRDAFCRSTYTYTYNRGKYLIDKASIIYTTR